MWVKKARLGLSRSTYEMDFLQVRVAGMGFGPERVEDQDVEMLQVWERLVRDVGHIGQVRGGAEAVAGNGFAPVNDWNPLEDGAKQRNLSARAFG